MTLDEAKTILKGDIQADGTLYAGDEYTHWDGSVASPVVLDGRFDLDRLEAIVVYCRWAMSPKDTPECPA